MIDFEKLKLKFDNGKMFEAILGFPDQIKLSLFTMKNWEPKESYTQIQNILIIGMGGSILGTQAIYDFLKHKINNRDVKNIYCKSH